MSHNRFKEFVLFLEPLELPHACTVVIVSVVSFVFFCFVYLLYIGNKIFMFRNLYQLILESPKRAMLCFVRSKYQRLNMFSIDLLSSWVRFSI